MTPTPTTRVAPRAGVWIETHRHRRSAPRVWSLPAREQGAIAAVALAPVGVLPEQQRNGIGSALIQAGLEQARRAAHRIVIVVGDPAYYSRFGFSAELAAPLRSKYAGAAFMALELVVGALDGVRGECIIQHHLMRYDCWVWVAEYGGR